MSNAIARFRKRKNVQLVEVSWPTENPQFKFTVSLFSEKERRGAEWAGEKILADRGIPKPMTSDPDVIKRYKDELNGTYWLSLAFVVKKHLKGWKHEPTDGEPIPFTPANVEVLFDEMSDQELMNVGLGYLLSREVEHKKKESSPSTEKASSMPSESGSSTTSTTSGEQPGAAPAA